MKEDYPNVQKVKLTNEVAKDLKLTTQYVLMIAKIMQSTGLLSETDFRMAGKRNYLFNEKAIELIKEQIKKTKK